jgi:hypothetical protein
VILQRTWHDDRVDAVAGRRVAVETVVGHRQRVPTGVVSRVGQTDIGARVDGLILEVDALDAVRVGHFHGDGDCLAADWLLNRLRQLPHLRRGVGSEDGVLRAGSGQAEDVARDAQLEIERDVAAAA